MELRRLTPERLELIEELLAGGRTVRMTVTGQSMRPTIYGNEVIHLQRARRVDVGEVILVRTPDDRPLVHRVLEQRDDQIRTGGDALAEPDDWMPVDNVIGRVIRVEPRRATRLARRAIGALRDRLG